MRASHARGATTRRDRLILPSWSFKQLTKRLYQVAFVQGDGYDTEDRITGPDIRRGRGRCRHAIEGRSNGQPAPQ